MIKKTAKPKSTRNRAVGIRAKGWGQRWHSKGVNAVLTLRSLYQNERLESFWKHYCETKWAKIEQAA